MWRRVADCEENTAASTTGHVSARRPIPKSAPWINFNSCCSSKSSHPFSPHSLHWSRDEGRATRSEVFAMATPKREGIVPSRGDDDDGVSLGTMKIPPNDDLQRFESLHFPWANSLCHGANLPLPVPLKVDKVPARGSASSPYEMGRQRCWST